MPDEDIDDDKYFAEEIAAARHKELKDTLRELATAIGQPKEDKAVAEAIKKSAAASQLVADAIKAIPQPKTPDVNVQFDHKSFVTSMQAIKDEIVESNKSVVTALENKPMVDEFKISQDQWGGMKTAKVIYKKASEITFKK